MATTKVKGTSKKIKELKGIKPEKVTDEQLKRIQETVSIINRAHSEIGTIETKKHALMHQVSASQEVLHTLQTELEKEYGTVDININDGTINYAKEDGQANS
tara:strand:+ start:1351 stop:1656 length:306 start_codon:yes stop_codon:yes gene_type:complete